jgi:hypothetical protein
MPTTINGSTGVSLVQDGTITPAKTTGQRVLAQIVTFQTGAVATGTTIIPVDNTIPQNTEGTEFMSLAITPVSATSTLEIDIIFIGNEATNHSDAITVALYKDSATDAIAACAILLPGVPFSGCMASGAFKHIMTSGSASLQTFKVRAGANQAGTIVFNGATGGSQVYGGVSASRITIKEYLP